MPTTRRHWVQTLVFILSALYLALKVWAAYELGDGLSLVGVLGLYARKRWAVYVFLIGRLLHALFRGVVGGPAVVLSSLVSDVLIFALLGIVVLVDPPIAGRRREA